MRFGITKTLFFLFLFTLTWQVNSFAVSLSPQAVEKLKREGRLQEWIDLAKMAREKGVWAPSSNPPLKFTKDRSLATDTLKPLFLLVDFDDNVHSRDTSEFNQLLFSTGFFYPTGSFRDYYLENSYQQLDLPGGQYGWIRAPQLYSYYEYGMDGFGSYPHNAQKLVEDAVYAADPYVNFADYDFDNDGWVDGLNVIHAGPGAEEGADSAIWSHKWVTHSVLTVDGVHIYEYAMSPEIRVGGDLVGIGVICHEFGHVLGAIDVYDYDGTSFGLGDWSIMATGSWNHDGKTPAHFDAYHKYAILGFSSVTWIQSNQTNVEILQAETSPIAYRLWTSGQGGAMYFLVENRQKTGFDSYVPGHGLLIYHVDQNSPNNDHEWCPGDPASVHYKVALEQADGRFQLEGCYGFGLNDGDGGDPFPGYQDRRAFDDTTTPSSRDYYDNSTQVAVWNISDSDSAMYANIDVTWSRPNLAIEEFFFNDSTGGDGDGRPEPDETVKLYFALSNTWADFINAWVIASTDTEGIYFSVDSVNLGDISSGDTVDNFGDPIEFTVASDFPTKRVNFTLHICGDGGSYCIDLIKERAVGPTEILLVDDAGDYQSYYTDALDSIRQIYDIWEAHSKGDPDFSFNQYEYLIWYTGDHRTSMFTQAQVESLMSFLDNGGKLFLTSQDAVEVLSGSSDPWDTLFLNNYLHVGYGGYFGEYLIAEQEGDEIGDGTYIFPLGSPGAQNQTSKDILVPDSEANPVLIHGHNWFVPATDSFAATKFQNDFFKVVVFGFGFEAINQDKDEHQGKILSKPHIVMERVLNWLRGSSDIIDWEEEFASLPKTIHLAQNYPNPFNPETKIEFRIKGGTSLVHISFKIYNIRGQLVRTLLDEERSPGVYSVTWDGKDQKGYEVSSGIYFYQLKTEDHSEVKKMILLK